MQQLHLCSSISVQGATQYEVGHCSGVMVGRRTKLVASGQRFIGTPGGERSPRRVTIAPHLDQKVDNYKIRKRLISTAVQDPPLRII